MDEALVRLVWDRAGGVCEYCRLPREYSRVPFEIDHIIARKHGGATSAANLALTCFYCNSYKGPNVAGVDPKTGLVTRLFHPRRHKWARHFRWDGSRMVGRTAIGRTTIAVLVVNHSEAIALRTLLMAERRLSDIVIDRTRIVSSRRGERIAISLPANSSTRFAPTPRRLVGSSASIQA